MKWFKNVSYTQVIEELADKVKKLKDNEKHVAILHDEMSIKQDLVSIYIIH